MEEEVILKLTHNEGLFWILCTLDCARNYLRKHTNMVTHKEIYYFRDRRRIKYEDIDVEIVTDPKYISAFKIVFFPDTQHYCGDLDIYKDLEDNYEEYESVWDNPCGSCKIKCGSIIRCECKYCGFMLCQNCIGKCICQKE